MSTDMQTEVARILELLQRPFWGRADFWFTLIGLLLTTAGLFYSFRAFREAKAAKKAATAAGRTVRLQTVAIELSEIIQKLEKLQPSISFNEAQELLNEVSRRLRRFVSPFMDDAKLSGAITPCLTTLDAAQKALNSVRPTSPGKESEVPGVTYYAVQSDFASINSLVAALLGLFEKESFHFGEYDARS